MDLVIDQKKYKPDLKYQSYTVSKLINMSNRKGKKNISRKNIYKALDIIEKQMKQEPLNVLETAIANVAPNLEVRSVRIGGANYQVPTPVSGERKVTLAMRWIIQVANQKKGKSFSEKLAEEIISAYKGEGTAMKKKNDVQRMAEANKAFAHFARRQ